MRRTKIIVGLLVAGAGLAGWLASRPSAVETMIARNDMAGLQRLGTNAVLPMLHAMPTQETHSYVVSGWLLHYFPKLVTVLPEQQSAWDKFSSGMYGLSILSTSGVPVQPVLEAVLADPATDQDTRRAAKETLHFITVVMPGWNQPPSVPVQRRERTLSAEDEDLLRKRYGPKP